MDMSGFVKALRRQDFGDNDSVIASSIMHPAKAINKLAEALRGEVNTAYGIPDKFDNPTPWLAPSREQQASAALNLAGLLQTGAFASGAAPKSAGGTLGTLSKATKRYKDGLLDPSFRGSHGAPMKGDSTAALHELNKIYPEDIYSREAAQYYGHGENEFQDRMLFNQIKALRGKPDEMVDVYRALPKDAPMEINHGDWVTTNKEYAVGHGKSVLDGAYKIKKMKVPVKALFTNGDSPYEFGLDLSVLDKPKGLPETPLIGNKKEENK